MYVVNQIKSKKLYSFLFWFSRKIWQEDDPRKQKQNMEFPKCYSEEENTKKGKLKDTVVEKLHKFA